MTTNNISEQNYEVGIIGGGAGGIMAALRSVLNNDQCVVFTGNGKDRKRSREQWVYTVENMPGYFDYKFGVKDPNKETIKFMQGCPLSDNLILKRNTSVTKIEKVDSKYHVTDNKGQNYIFNYLVVGTGVMDVQPEIQGSLEPIFPYANAQLVDYCLRCDGHKIYNKDSFVIGHSNSAAWVSVMLYERYNPPSMTILTNGKKFEATGDIVKYMDMYGITVNESPIKEIKGNPKEKILDGFELEDGSFVKCHMGFVSLGMIVYNELLKQVGADLDDRGFAITDKNGQTNHENLYVIGDLRAGVKKQIYTAWDTAVDSLDNINLKIRTSKREQLLANYQRN